MICLWGVAVSYMQDKTATDMIVGVKYGLQFFLVFLSATFLGYVFSHKGTSHDHQKLPRFLHRLFGIFIGVIVLWLVRQVSKMLRPDIFYKIGYAPFGDRVFGKNPPLYYLTWPGGYARLSGIFSWPNNYGYLFVWLFGFRWWYIRTYVKAYGWKMVLWVLFAASVLRSMSRGAIVGIFLQMVALWFVIFHAKRKYIRSLIIIGMVVVWALSLIKRWSTVAHVSAKFSSLTYVRENPLGYGLWSSWPSIHTGHWNILPENFFVQILIDIWVPGLILWLLFRYMVLRNIRTSTRNKSDRSSYQILLVCLSFSFLGLMLEWMFLHVFEDSMVNYRFFILRWVIYGYNASHSYAIKKAD